ncbi:MAG: efflux RND transporter periplasmic adaptor subunit [Rhodospirillales bacterium]|jgi:membrane fusion protein, multidrug efflux system|nr:efflux RND transporter periplasmic adaptor subunit [Rhodospirillales bacterium]
MKSVQVLRAVLPIIFAVATLGQPVCALAADGEFTVRKSTIVDRKAVFATVESIDSATARTRISGTISSLEVDEGSRVKKGSRLARVVDPKLRLSMQALEARIRSVAAQRDLARTALDRIARLRKSGIASQVRLDQAQTNMDVAEQQLAAMKAEKAVISQRQSEGVVLAPTDGRVLKVHVTQGTNVQPGEVVATLAADAFILRMHLPERHARFIQRGESVSIGGQNLKARSGSIRQVYPEMRQGRVVADVEVDGLGDYFVGERVPVYVAAGSRETFVVPQGFLFERFGVTYVRIKGIGENVVQTGQALEAGTEILSGLRDGDVLQKPEAAK